MDLQQVLEQAPGCAVLEGIRATWPTRTSSSCCRRRRSRSGRPGSSTSRRTRRSPTSSPTGSFPTGPAARRRHEPGRSARDAAAGADRVRPAPDPRLHRERQPAPEDGPRHGPRHAAGQRGGMGAGRARRHERAPLRPRQGERRAGAPDEDQAAAAKEYLRTFYVRHVALDFGRSSTWTSGLASRAWSPRSTAPASCGRRRCARRGVRPRGRRGHRARDDRAPGASRSTSGTSRRASSRRCTPRPMSSAKPPWGSLRSESSLGTSAACRARADRGRRG